MLRKKGELRTTYKFSAWETDEPLIRATEGSACFRGKNNVVCNKFNVGFPGGLAVKNLPLMPETQELWVQSWGWGESPGGGHGNLLQYSCRENPKDRGTWQDTVHRVAKSRTRLKQLSTHARALFKMFIE